LSCLTSQVERANAHAASEAASTAKAEAAGLAARLAEAEGELRALLTAVERQKAASAAKMRQLATLITDIT
jgi:leucine-rich repeat/coiled-coil domain-containing protein 1